jgi:uncharacterized protein
MHWLLNIVVAVAAGLAASYVQAQPSYNCDKAISAAEKQVCRVPDLQWYDRQLARLYDLARKEPKANQNALAAEQREFIVRREACRESTECLVQAYQTRLAALAPKVNVYEAYAEYQPKSFGGGLWIVRFPFNAAVKILTVGDGGHTCVFEADNAELGGKGVIRWRDPNENACRMTIAPDGDDIMRVETKNCSDYCGMRAVLDGEYTRLPKKP